MQFCRHRREKYMCQGSVGGVHRERARERFDNRSFYGDGTHNIAHSAARRLLVFCSNCCSSHYANDGGGISLTCICMSVWRCASCFFVHAWCAHAARVLHFRPRIHTAAKEKRKRERHTYAKGHPKNHRAAQNAAHRVSRK